MERKKNFAITNEVRVLRYMRINAGLSLRQAGRLLDMTDGAISHIENGKMALPLSRIDKMVTAYGHTMADFFKMSRAKVVPASRREECERLLKTVPNALLEKTFEFLKTLTGENYV